MLTQPIICVAPTGARKTTNDHPNLPVTAEAIANEARACRDAGANMIHLHVRDKKQKHTLDTGLYREAISAIHKQAGKDLIIQVTTEAAGMYTPVQQVALVKNLKPQAVSIAIREIIPCPSYEPAAKSFFTGMLVGGTFIQYILYSPDELRYFARLRRNGIIPGKEVSVLFVLGKKHGSPDKPDSSWAKPDDLNPFLAVLWQERLLPHTHWMICAFGGNELACMQKATSNGGHVRIGFENNHLLENGSIAPDNAALIRQFCEKEARSWNQDADLLLYKHN